MRYFITVLLLFFTISTLAQPAPTEADTWPAFTARHNSLFTKAYEQRDTATCQQLLH